MSIETDTKVMKLEQQMKDMQFQMSQIVAAINAMVEANGNSVLEGDEIEPKVRNGKLRRR